MLIEHMPVRATDRCLDLGCGYGPIGLHMAAEAREGHADLIDKDFVAIDYSQRNAASHGLDNCRAFLSNGFSHIAPDARYDLIATNLPAKAGNELYYLYFYDALARMAPGARFYIVTISGLRKFIQRSFVEVFGNYQKLKQGSTYTVAMAELPPS